MDFNEQNHIERESQENATTNTPEENNGWYPYAAPQNVTNEYTAPQQPTAPVNQYTAPSTNEGYVHNPYSGPWNPQPPKPPRKKKSAGVIGMTVVAIISAVCLFTGVALTIRNYDGKVGNTPKQESPAGDYSSEETPTLEISNADDTAELLSVKSAIQANLNSTVSLVIYSQQSSSIGNIFGFGTGTSDDSELVATGGASGIVMTADGYIITNCHCVINENTAKAYPRIDVKMYDGTVYENATIIGADQDTDLAVIKVNAKGLTPAVFGDSSTLELGDTVIALGNAGGLGWTPTRGILSGMARDVYDDTGYSIKCLQTDAAINPGNSGGPLINLYGQVIGINSAKIVSTEYESLGFAIPINEAKTIIDNLLKNGYVSGRVSLGITGKTVKLLNYAGFQIATIDDDSDLKNTDAKVGDIITHVDGNRVSDYSGLRTALTKHNIGDTVKLTLLRMGDRGVSTIEVSCKLIANKG